MYVRVDGDNFTRINKTKNVRDSNGGVILNLRDKDPSKLKDVGIYTYKPAARIPGYKRAVSRSHEIDHEKGEVREVIVTEDRNVKKLKEDKKAEIERRVYSGLRNCDHLVLEALEKGVDIPQDCKDYRQALRNKRDQALSEISSFKSAKKVFEYSVDLPEEVL